MLSTLFTNLYDHIKNKEVCFIEELLIENSIENLKDYENYLEVNNFQELLNFNNNADFASKPKCKKGYPCKNTCISVDKDCDNPIEGQAKTYVDFLKVNNESKDSQKSDQISVDDSFDVIWRRLKEKEKKEKQEKKDKERQEKKLLKKYEDAIYKDYLDLYINNNNYKYILYPGEQMFEDILQKEGNESSALKYIKTYFRQKAKSKAQDQRIKELEQIRANDILENRNKIRKQFPGLSKLVGKLVVTDIDSEVVQTHLKHLSKIPAQLIEKIANSQLTIHLGNNNVGGFDVGKIYKDRIARGWGSDITYDEIGGAYSPRQKAVMAGKDEEVGTVSLVLHELGHGLGDVFDHDNDSDLIKVHKELYPRLNPYLQQEGAGGLAGRQELLAEGVAEVLIDRNKALKRFNQAFVNYIERTVLGVIDERNTKK